MNNKYESQLSFAGTTYTLVPHTVEHVGARVFVVVENAEQGHEYTPNDLRMIATRLKLAADTAEALERKLPRRTCATVAKVEGPLAAAFSTPRGTT